MVRLCRQYKALRLCWGDASHQEAARSFDLQQSREGSLCACERSSVMSDITRISSAEMMLSGDPVVLDTAEELPGLPWLSLRKQPFCNPFFHGDSFGSSSNKRCFQWEFWLVLCSLRQQEPLWGYCRGRNLGGWPAGASKMELSFLQSETLVFLEAVQQLEFEKWRDAELYDDIKATKHGTSFSHFLEQANSQRAVIFEKIASTSWIFNDIHGVFFT